MALRVTPEKREERDRIRLALLRATLRLAAVHGFASLGLREVAREAAIAPTSFYRHFADMNELGEALIRELVSPILAEWAELSTAAAKRGDLVQTLVDAMFGLATRDPELARFVLSESAGAFASFRAALREKLDELAAVLRSSLGPTFPAETAIAVLLDAVNRLLDCDPLARDALRTRLIQTLDWLVANQPSSGRTV